MRGFGGIIDYDDITFHMEEKMPMNSQQKYKKKHSKEASA